MAWTKENQREYLRKYAELHKNDPAWKASQRNRQRRKRHKMKRMLIELLGGKCSRCGFNEHIHALEFDHKIPTEKLYEPSYLISSGSYAKALEYIGKKCTLLCGNCHVLKTVAYADNLRGTNISDTTEERLLFESRSQS